MAEYVIYGTQENAENEYWTINTAIFTAENTQNLALDSRVYISVFLTPAGEQYGDVETGFTFLETEYFLQVEICGQ